MAVLSPALARLSDLQHLNLAFNTIGARGAAALAVALEGMGHLRELNLFNNFLTEAGVQVSNKAAHPFNNFLTEAAGVQVSNKAAHPFNEAGVQVMSST